MDFCRETVLFRSSDNMKFPFVPPDFYRLYLGR